MANVKLCNLSPMPTYYLKICQFYRNGGSNMSLSVILDDLKDEMFGIM